MGEYKEIKWEQAPEPITRLQMYDDGKLTILTKDSRIKRKLDAVCLAERKQSEKALLVNTSMILPADGGEPIGGVYMTEHYKAFLGLYDLSTILEVGEIKERKNDDDNS